MVLKFMESTVDSFKDKLKNPFLGTLLLVWIIRNRQFLFNLFFNENYDSEKRLTLLTEHFSGGIVVVNFALTLCYSLLLLALIYVFLNFSRFIVQFSETTIRPKILKIFSLNSIVAREEFTKIEEQRDYYQKRYSEERNEKLKLQRELDELKKPNLFGGPSKKEYENRTEIDAIKILLNDWVTDGYLSKFTTLIGSINDMDKLYEVKEKLGVDIEIFLSKNIIRAYIENKAYFYKFTPYGEKVKNYYLENSSTYDLM